MASSQCWWGHSIVAPPHRHNQTGRQAPRKHPPPGAGITPSLNLEQLHTGAACMHNGFRVSGLHPLAAFELQVLGEASWLLGLCLSARSQASPAPHPEPAQPFTSTHLALVVPDDVIPCWHGVRCTRRPCYAAAAAAAAALPPPAHYTGAHRQ